MKYIKKFTILSSIAFATSILHAATTTIKKQPGATVKITQPNNAGVVSPDGTRLLVEKIVSNENGTTITTNLYSLLGSKKTHNRYSSRFSPDGSKVILLLNQNTIGVYDSSDMSEIGTAPINNGWIFSPNNKNIIVNTTNNNKVTLYDAATMQRTKAFKGDSGSFSPKGKKIVIYHYNNDTADIYNSSTLKKIRTIEDTPFPIKFDAQDNAITQPVQSIKPSTPPAA